MTQSRDDIHTDAPCPVEQLGWYANGTLAATDLGALEAHLVDCARCQARVRAWTELRHALRAVSAQTPPPRADLFAQIEQRIAALPAPAPLPQFDPRQLAGAFVPVLAAVGALVLMQARLLRRELFWMPLLLLPVAGALVYLPLPWRQAPDAAAFLAALLAALGMAMLYGRDSDPAREMALVTPTSPRVVLGLRCGLVFGFDLAVNVGLVLPFLTLHGVLTPAWFVAHWLAPLCFLSTLALLLSVVVSTNAAVLTCASLWGLRALDAVPQVLFGGSGVFSEAGWQRLYGAFWQQAPLLFVGAAVAALVAFVALEGKERFAR